MDSQEEWRPVKGHEGYYEVSNTGKVRSLVGRYKSKPIFEMKPVRSQKGYYNVDLSKPIRKRWGVHVLVASAFLEQPEGCTIVNHLDNDPSNNNLDNLEWTTYSGNLLHAQKQGRLFEAQSKGGKVQGAKATKALIEAAEAMIGNQYGNLTVFKLGKVVKYGRANRPRLVCQCSCGNIAEYDKILLEKGQATRCRSCVGKAAYLKNAKEIIDKYNQQPIGPWVFTGKSNIDEATTSKQLKLEAVCNDCGNHQLLPYCSILGYPEKVKLTCKKCKNKT